LTQTELIQKRLDGKIAVITGGSSGLGLATAQRFVAEGAYVFITGRRERDLNAAVKQIGKNVTSVQGDVSNLSDLDKLYATVKRQKGRIDILFANAGLWEFVRLEVINEAHFDKLFNVNVKGLLFTVQKALPLFQDGGSIILMASIGGSKGVEGLSVYHATKAAIRSFARSWTVDLKQQKIRVNSISPGPIDTPGLRHALQNVQDAEKLITTYLNAIPLGKFGNPDDIASAVTFLASNDSTFVTGIELSVDGGMAQI
jgi:NAD(P)-dependent dehydrogenase (short-subunit alcohol dehydrogenase family)